MGKIFSWFCYLFLKPLVSLIWIKKVVGKENVPKGNFILAANHRSHWDQVMTAFVCVPRPFTYLGQIDKYVGFEGFLRDLLYKIAGVVPIHRYNPESKKKALKECVKALQEGKILIMYPEGTRSRTNEFLPPKPGVAKLHFLSQKPILPVAIKGNFEVMPPGRVFPKFKKIVEINIGKPLEFKEEMERAKNLDCRSQEYLQICENVAQKVMEEIKRLYEQL